MDGFWDFLDSGILQPTYYISKIKQKERFEYRLNTFRVLFHKYIA